VDICCVQEIQCQQNGKGETRKPYKMEKFMQNLHNIHIWRPECCYNTAAAAAVC